MNPDRSWMYRRRANGFLQPSFVKGVNGFVEFATTQPRFMNGTKIKCPCAAKKCQNKPFLDTESVKVHLVKNGFVPDYEVWTFHGEIKPRPDEGGSSQPTEEDTLQNPYINMIFDEGRRSIPDFNVNDDGSMNEDEPPNPNAQKFYDMLEAANEPLWDGCENHTKLDTKKKGEKMSKNRKSETGGPGSGLSIHVRGSLSTRGHAKILKSKLGREPDFFELMHKTHFKKDGSGYCDARAEKIAASFNLFDEVQARKAALEQCESDESVNMNDFYIKVAGVKKQRIFGSGEVGSSKKSVITSTAVQIENEELRHKVETLTTELEEERNARAAQAEDERAARDELEKRLTSAMDERVTQAMTNLMKQFEERLCQQSA